MNLRFPEHLDGARVLQLGSYLKGKDIGNRAKPGFWVLILGKEVLKREYFYLYRKLVLCLQSLGELVSPEAVNSMGSS